MVFINWIRACLVLEDKKVPSIFQDDPIYLELCIWVIAKINVWI